MAKQKEKKGSASLSSKLYRSKNDRVIAGVCSGLGEFFQVDATINYITDKNDPGVSLKDTKIDSPYNTYKYKGLPKGPISNPGMESMVAALNPKDSPYWYYLSDGTTIFSKTLEEHNSAKAKYLD